MKTVQFQANKMLEMYLELVYNRYAEILARLEDVGSHLIIHAPKQQPTQKMSISYIMELDDKGKVKESFPSPHELVA